MTTEIEDDLDNGELEVVTKKLTAIQSSLKILTHVPDYEDRVLHVEGLKNRVEALCSPQLVQAFNNTDLEKAKFFVQVFADMDRSSQLLKYYRKCVRARLLRTWSELVTAATGSMAFDDSEMKAVSHAMVDCMSKFFGQVTKIVVEQVRGYPRFCPKISILFSLQLNWFTKVFIKENGLDNVIEILLDVYSSMDPKPDVLIESSIKQHGDDETRKVLDFLIELKKIFNKHVFDLDSALLEKGN